MKGIQEYLLKESNHTCNCATSGCYSGKHWGNDRFDIWCKEGRSNNNACQGAFSTVSFARQKVSARPISG